ncbi:ATP phosphoribosyltransferase [Lottiidibacillus patelloidae]|uniref:ATP phosphoribosyltransferase n=1 Tax=Lottiidibacillus patelloidae TaxID=2670334 RepID=A0A263BTG1_9BACI|nr:ATP phosphoribosyltransferase [Lottiidibacillus patelloidae]OZM56989.1 ATP phosphoribosyltransferase [Lottiidibacillus patelloidae]
MNELTIALAKGRLAEDAYNVFKGVNLANNVDLKSRKLIFEDKDQRLRFIIVKPSDVITYVEQGVADIGVVGKDTILEQGGNIYELLDLPFGECRFAVAGYKGKKINRKDEVLKVATKYPKITVDYFAEKGQRIQTIKLNGSVELAPLVGLSDVIVDIVETGNTLKANGLEVLEEMFEVRAKLIANRVSYRFKAKEINAIQTLLRDGRENFDTVYSQSK